MRQVFLNTRAIRDERGSLSLFNIIMYILMLAAIGFGWDVMRVEYERAALQYNLDNATLAAADLDQLDTPATVVVNYMTAAGLGDYVSADDVIADTTNINSKTVYVAAERPFNSPFAGTVFELTDMSSIDIPAVSEAKESVEDLEITLVLDTSGSMDEDTTYIDDNGATRTRSKLASLKVAAKDFVSDMVAKTEDGKLSISIVPYAQQVSMPQEVFDLLPHSNEHSYSRCINFRTSDYQRYGLILDGSRTYDQTYFFDDRSEYWVNDDDRSHGYSDGRYRNPDSLVYSYNCQNETWRDAMLFQKDKGTLHDYIDALGADGWTSIDVGVVWGAATLHEDFNAIINPLATPDAGGNSYVPAEFSDRPLDRNVRDSIKVLVVMTDGRNTRLREIKNNFRLDNTETGIYWHEEDQVYSQWSDTDNSYGYYDEDFTDPSDFFETNSSEPYKGDESIQLSFAELVAKAPTEHIRTKFYAAIPDLENTNPRNNYGQRAKDTRTLDACAAVKSAGIQVYTIAFEAGADGEAVLDLDPTTGRGCASSQSHFFDAQGGQGLENAFNAIATSISQLRLTQ